MAKENKEKVEETKVEKTKDDVTKVKLKSKNQEETITKVNISEPPLTEKNEEVEQPAEEEVVVVNDDSNEEEAPVLEEITDDEIAETENQIEEAIAESEISGTPLPENVQKLVDFMEETGGNLEDYVSLNRDTSNMDDSEVLDEYYRTTKSHLTPEERGFLLEESFGYDEETDDAKEIRKRKIALKEQVAEAKAYLDGQKSKYYEDIKAGSKLTQEQQKAIDFFNRYNKESEQQRKETEASKKIFKQKTDSVFNKNFKGFDYQVGDKKFRFNVKNMNEVKDTQSDLKNFISKFVGKNESTIEDAAGYHKSLFTAMNPDAVAKHFYEQGQADAIKDQVAKDKNIDMNPRKTHGETEVGGIKYKVLGDTANDFKFKIKRKK